MSTLLTSSPASRLLAVLPIPVGVRLPAAPTPARGFPRLAAA